MNKNNYFICWNKFKSSGYKFVNCNVLSVFSRIFFKGDTLFLGGCGRFFEGDATQMNRALNEVLAGLDNETVATRPPCMAFLFLKNC